MLTEKICSTCKKILPVDQFYPHKRMKSGLQPACKTCSREWHRARPDYIRKKNAEFKEKNPTYHRDWQRQTKFGLSPDEVEVIRKLQDYKCAGCKKELKTSKECVDHNHMTGKVRGLLCNACNVSLGALEESIDTLFNLIEYIKKHSD